MVHLPSLEDYSSKEAKMACIFVLKIFVIIMVFISRRMQLPHQDQAWLVFLL